MDLPLECWELIFNSLDDHRHFEFLSLVCKRFLCITNQLRRSLTITDPIIPFLPHLFRRFCNIKEIRVRDFYGDLNSLLHQISQSELDLESLDISNQNQFPSLGLLKLGKKMKNLRRLNCSKIWFLQDRDLFAIGKSFPFLEELDISYPEYCLSFSPDGSRSLHRPVTDSGVLDLCLKLNNLRKINLSGNQLVSDKTLVNLSLNCALLRDIVILECDFITQSGIGLAMRDMPNLNSISLDEIGIPSISSFFQESFAYARALTEVDFSNSFLSDGLLCLIAEACLPLKKLVISNCYSYPFAGISLLLNRYQFIGHLDIEGANFLTDDSMIELSKFLCHLTYINLSSCSKLTSATFFTLTRTCLLLQEIKMERTNLGVEEFATEFAINPQVKSLSLAGNHCLGDECIKRVAFTCPNLQVLDISCCLAITDEGVREVLRSCHQIRNLNMSRCGRINDFEIDFELPNLEVLQAEGPGMNDEALTIIGKRCHGLLHLNLEGCLDVTASGVKELVENCTGLREINLKWCNNVNVDIVAWMEFSRPSLRKIIPPCGFAPTQNQRNFFLLHGCLVCKG